MPDVETEEEVDPTEAVRIAIMLVGLALNLWMVYDFLKERPDVMIARQRLRNWWARTVTAPEKAARALRRAEGETVFEAISILEGK